MSHFPNRHKRCFNVLNMEKIPSDLEKALKANLRAKAKWESLTPIGRRDFISWIESAKQLETRKRRINVTRSKLLSGQRRPCCYAIVPMDLYKALNANPKARDKWKNLTPDKRRDFIDWIDSAKDAEAKKLRINKSCIMLVAGKQRPR